ncbi:alanine--glyoxylate aminotransferase family protein [Rhizobium johnstonii]|uniref:pyridoxal-phosphate-dependent aminotransferase family protein n=1 Tax=Rhizobium TaxID=379 RepID=UPI0010310FCF|nr:aminotransferase class V-fold PLP-dependent enzyme [Rhizobium leguminosarum]TBF70829.1 aminotransferase class V-fold PLP-dependent enzyme [Rhizobium leguminosarum]TBG93302.1 aminotransferase class V-fold PLP-dependent enzyme [Rhizobium leguminosarum]TBG98704.1 aminotransferase class V-fold PLP-dependent enzyme [Rhizobium leguminosarum]TBH29917.1 aminotransferase class V-fold PLP-dependent enzyme [Rhizobium leguminosarum]TBH50147.1 aminotransferase class V-fold PLP-dependent enzyme [Rhizobiu
MRSSGRHFLQLPGPTNVPLSVLAAIAQPTVDHRGPDFPALTFAVVEGMKAVFKTAAHVVIYPASGTGAWEAALVNAFSPGDTVLMAETGHFSTLWKTMAARLGLQVEFLPGDWRGGADLAAIEARLSDDRGHKIKAVAVVHNETSTGAVSDVAGVRRALDSATHPALLMVDTISSLASIDYRHDEWRVDVTVGGSQKGLMLPPGLSFNAISEKALQAARSARLPRVFWDWEDMISMNSKGYFPYTPATNMLQGLKVALEMLQEEGLSAVFARHDRAAEATRACVRHWGLRVWCAQPSDYSSSLTAVQVPEGFSADTLRSTILAQSSVSLGNGLGRLADRVFRIGHLGDFNDATTLATLASVERGLLSADIPVQAGGVGAAIASLSKQGLSAIAAE